MTAPIEHPEPATLPAAAPLAASGKASPGFVVTTEVASPPLAVPRRRHGEHPIHHAPRLHAADPLDPTGTTALCGKLDLHPTGTAWPGPAHLDRCPVCDQLAWGASHTRLRREDRTAA